MILLKQMIILFLLMMIGFLCRKREILSDEDCSGISRLVINVANPALVLTAGINPQDTLKGRELLTAAFLSVGVYVFLIAASFAMTAIIRPQEKNRGTYRVMTVFSNIGFMGFPVALIFFGENGLLLMLAHNAAMNFFFFTYGLKLLRRNYDAQRRATPKSALRALCKLMLNPNILALMIGFVVSLLGGAIPEAVDEYLLYLGNISTPMAMIFIGSTLTGYKFFDIIKSRLIIETSIVKLLIMPLITAGIVYFLPLSAMIKSILVLGICFPVAATVSMLTEQEGHDPSPASKALFLSTVVSIVTVPVAINIINILFM